MTCKFSIIVASTTNLQPYTLESEHLSCETNHSHDKSQPPCEAELTLCWNLAARIAVALLAVHLLFCPPETFVPPQTFPDVLSEGDRSQTFLWPLLLPEENLTNLDLIVMVNLISFANYQAISML